MEISRIKPSLQTVKKAVYLLVSFRGQTVADILGGRLQVTGKDTYFVIELRILFTSRSTMLLQTKDKQPMDSTSNSVYQFTSTCGTR